MKVKDMPNGTILWNGYNILGIKGSTLENKYGEKYYNTDKCMCYYPYDGIRCKHDDFVEVLEFDKFEKKK